MDEQASFAFEPLAAETGTPAQRRLPPETSIDLVFLKTLAYFGSVEKLQAGLAERGKADPGMIDFLNAFNAWNEPVSTPSVQPERK